MTLQLVKFLGDRIQVNSFLIVLCFASVLLLESQSAASYPSYILAFYMLITYRRWNDIFSLPVIWLVSGLIFYLCLSSLWSDPFGWIEMLRIFGRGLLVFLFVIALAESQLRGQVQEWLARTLAIVGSFAAFAAITLYLLSPDSHGRMFGLGQLDNPIVAALIFGAVLLVALQLYLTEDSSFWRVAAVACVAVVLTAVILTGSRNSWVSIGFAATVLLVAHRSRDPQRFLVFVVALLLIGLVGLSGLLFDEESRAWLLPRGGSYRLEIWKEVLGAVWPGHSLFGLGILTPDQVVVGDRVFSHPHNMYLAVLYAGGIVGLALFLCVTAAVLRNLFVGYEIASAKLGLGLLALALASYSLDGHELVDKVGETWFLYWLPVGLGVGVSWGRLDDQAE